MKKWSWGAFLVLGLLLSIKCGNPTSTYPVPIPKPLIYSFTASPETIIKGDSSELAWKVTIPADVSLDDGFEVLEGLEELGSALL